MYEGLPHFQWAYSYSSIYRIITDKLRKKSTIVSRCVLSPPVGIFQFTLCGAPSIRNQPKNASISCFCCCCFLTIIITDEECRGRALPTKAQSPILHTGGRSVNSATHHTHRGIKRITKDDSIVIQRLI